MINILITLLKYEQVKFSIPEIDGYSKLAIGKFIKAINIINNLKVNLLLYNLIFILKSINLLINKENITINNW